MTKAIAGLEPARVWHYFAEIAQVPRCSKHEERIREYVLKTAKGLGLQARVDGVGNVAIRKPASGGHERAPSVALQGHLDMVCEKNKDKVHDFSKDAIELVRNGDWMTANGTTLGADNGIAVASILAVLEDKSLSHGPLEALFTIDEETGLTGAGGLASDLLESRILLNLDSEEEYAVYVGCSGGRDTTGTWSVTYDDVPAKAVPGHLTVTGLRGGHSGLEIDKGRGNAVKLLGRALIQLDALGARIASLQGGNKRNAIPREAEALVWITPANWDEAMQAIAWFDEIARAELQTVEPDLKIQLSHQKGARRGGVIKKSLQKKLLQTLSALPHGVVKMSADIEGLVETSTNVASIATDRAKKRIVLATSQRSSVASEIEEICHTVSSILTLGGAEASGSDGYPGWKPNLDSEILKVAIAVHKQIFGKEPAVKAIHAGLECGIIGEKMPGMDMVSFGPTLEEVHSPDERLNIPSVGRFYQYLTGILETVATER
jgi:dipeptidase D